MHNASEAKIKILEEIALNAWHPLQQSLYDGWVLRFADGYTKRANSVNVLYPSTQDIAEKISRCETIYLSKNLQPIFRITPLACPENLDKILVSYGYEKKDLSSVQTLSLLPFNTSATHTVKIWLELSQEWLDNLVHFAAIPLQYWETLTEILLNIPSKKCFAILYKDNQAVACGLGVLERQYIGLFEIVTAQHQRKKGYGKELILNIIDWGKKQGATQAYLQVVMNNIPALNLYAKLGFKESYQYFYLIK